MLLLAVTFNVLSPRLSQLRQSRQHEYEADQLALALGSGAGMNR